MWTLKIKINIEFWWSKNLRSKRFLTGFLVFLFRNTTNGIHPYLAIASFTRPPSSEVPHHLIFTVCVLHIICEERIRNKRHENIMFQALE